MSPTSKILEYPICICRPFYIQTIEAGHSSGEFPVLMIHLLSEEGPTNLGFAEKGFLFFLSSFFFFFFLMISLCINVCASYVCLVPAVARKVVRSLVVSCHAGVRRSQTWVLWKLTASALNCWASFQTPAHRCAQHSHSFLPSPDIVS